MSQYDTQIAYLLNFVDVLLMSKESDMEYNDAFNPHILATYDSESDMFSVPSASTLRKNFLRFLCNNGVLTKGPTEMVKNIDAFATGDLPLILKIMKWLNISSHAPLFVETNDEYKARVIRPTYDFYLETRKRTLRVRKENYEESEQRLRAKALISKNIVLYMEVHGDYLAMKMVPGENVMQLESVNFEDPTRTFNHVQIAPVGSGCYSTPQSTKKAIEKLHMWQWGRKLHVANLRMFVTRICDVTRTFVHLDKEIPAEEKQFHYDKDKMGRMTITQGAMGAKVANKFFSADDKYYKCFYVDDTTQPPTVLPFFPFQRIGLENDFINNREFSVRELHQQFYGMGFLNVVLIDTTCSMVRGKNNERDQRTFRRVFMQSQNNISDEDYDSALDRGAAPHNPPSPPRMSTRSSKRRKKKGGGGSRKGSTTPRQNRNQRNRTKKYCWHY